MAYTVLEATDAAIGALEKDDVSSRQSIVVRDGAPWGVKGKVVLVQGSDEGVKHAEQVAIAAGAAKCAKAAQVKTDVDAESDAAAGGMGFVFG